MEVSHSRLGAVLPMASIVVLGIIASLALASYVGTQNIGDSEQAFDRDASAATAEIEREIERHVTVIDDTVQFAESTWPGEIDEWRHYVEGRITGGTHLAFSSTAALIERIPADQVEAVTERESATSGRPFSISQFAPLPTEADRLVLTRTGEDSTAGLDILGLEVTAAVNMLGVSLPGTDEGLGLTSVNTAPEPIIELLGIQRNEFIQNDVFNTNAIFVRAVGPESEPPLGWVVVPAELGYLLVNAVGDLDGGDLNITVNIPGAYIDGDLGRYVGDVSTDLMSTSRFKNTTIDLGGWNWVVTVWASEDYGIGSNRVRGVHVLLGGLAITALLAVLTELRRRHGIRLMLAEFEVELQKTLAETDPLTGLLNRQGLRALRHDEAAIETITADGAGTFFLDLDGFKQINDELGHAAGDSILVAVAKAVRGVARDHDYVGRIGGDEFVLVCPGIADEESAQLLAGRMREAIAEIQDPGPVGVSIGLAINRPGNPFHFDSALELSDSAMYLDKKAGKNSQAASLVKVGKN